MTAMRRTQIQFVKFLLVGALNTAFGYGIYAMLIWFGLRPFLAVAVGTVLGVLFNFQSTGWLIFGNARPGLFWRFVLVYVFNYFVNIAALSLTMSQLGLNAYLAGAVMLLPMALLTFILQRKFVFTMP
jgi:putative flippase GtrA